MSNVATVPSQVTRQGDNFFLPFDPHDMRDLSYLLPGQTEWYGPIPDNEPYWTLEREKVHCEYQAARHAADGIFLHTKIVGRYSRTRRLSCGPAMKLSDWVQLEIGQSMLLSIEASDEDISLGEFRCAYVRRRMGAAFALRTDADASLWVTRNPPPNSGRLIA